MLTARIRLWVVALFAFALAACGPGSDGEDVPLNTATLGRTPALQTETSEAPSTVGPGFGVTIDHAGVKHVALGESAPGALYAESLGTLVGWFETAIVGEVVGVKEVRSTYDSFGWETRETIFDVEVKRAIRGDVEAGQHIALLQTGEYRDGVAYDFPDDPLVTPGTTYLMFLHSLLPFFGRDEYTGAGFARFLVSEDGLVIPNGFEGEAGISAVSGLTYDDVKNVWFGDDPFAALEALARVRVEDAAARIRAAKPDYSQLPEPPATVAPASPKSTPTPGPATPTPTVTPSGSPAAEPGEPAGGDDPGA